MIYSFVLTLIVSMSTFADSSAEASRYWGQWRGPLATGVAPKAKPPVEWSEQKNVRWKIDLPGDGHSTPIVWGDLVYIQTASLAGDAQPSKKDDANKKEDANKRDDAQPTEPKAGERKVTAPSRMLQESKREDKPGEKPSGRGDRPEGERKRPDGPRGRRAEAPTEAYEFAIMSFERKSGKQVWKHVVRKEVPHEGSHQDGSLAPASPLTDGENVFAFFGSRGVYCFDMNGKLVWEKDLGHMKTRAGFGEGSSPVLYKDTLVINWDHEDGSFIVALDKKTGAERWRKSRDEVTTWATPLVLPVKGRDQIVVPATNRIRGYDLASGDVVWECGGLGANCIPSPVAAAGLVYAMSGYQNGAALAIRYEEAKGDISNSDLVAWKTEKGTPYVPSPLLYEDTIYFLQKNSQMLSCLDAKTGKPHYEQQRLDEIDGVYSSPLGADGRVYVLGRNGTTYVLKRGPQFEVLAVNKLSDDFSASPAAVDHELYLRGRTHLYCIAAE